MNFRPINTRRLLVVVHDLVVTAAAIIGSFFLRFDTEGIVERADGLLLLLPGFLIYAAGVYRYFDLYKGKWRFASLPDLHNIMRAATVLAISLLVLDYILVAPNILGTFFFGKLTILLYWLLQMFFLGGPRVAYRYFRYLRTRKHAMESESIRSLVLGRAADAEVMLRAIESGAVTKVWPVGILSPSLADQGQSMRGVPVLGTLEDMETIVADFAARGEPIARVVLTSSALEPECHPEAIVMKARRIGLATHRLPALDEGGEALRLAPVNVEDLLLRPSVNINYQRLEGFLRGKSIIVTGGGGSIGAEICNRVATFGAARLLVIENSEPALHAILELLAARKTNAMVEGRLADVRDRSRIFHLFEQFRPDIVFHAAALKHVPLIEENWQEGLKTNVFGSVNVADAATAAGAAGMVLVSTDKAIEPVSVLGASKRLAEMYCQALDEDFARRNCSDGPKIRIIAVRFGNVLASNGSVVPKFRAQIEVGGPVTVTHPGMVRYFMTIREACDLVVTAASHAVGTARSEVSVYVLNMGQPVKIMDLAERMIRLSGLEPGRDIEIKLIGIRSGERLQEILFAREEPSRDIGIEGIVAAQPGSPPLSVMRDWLAALEAGIAREDRTTIDLILTKAIPDFRAAHNGPSAGRAQIASA